MYDVCIFLEDINVMHGRNDNSFKSTSHYLNCQDHLFAG